MQVTSKDIDAAIKRFSNTKDGKLFLYALMTHCGYHQNLMSLDPSETQIYAAQRGVYGYFRKFIERDSLVDIEHNFEIKIDRKKDND